jgi:hypothetical protein
MATADMIAKLTEAEKISRQSWELMEQVRDELKVMQAAESGEPPPEGETPVADKYTPLVLGPVANNGLPVYTKTFGAGMVAMATLVVPKDTALGKGLLTVSEYNDPPTARLAWLSKKQWDMSGAAAPCFLTGKNTVFRYATSENFLDPWTVLMLPGETWYLMVRNAELISPMSEKPATTVNFGIKWEPVKP